MALLMDAGRIPRLVGFALVNRAGQSPDISRDTITITRINRTLTNVCGRLSTVVASWNWSPVDGGFSSVS